jgi:predicted ATPase
MIARIYADNFRCLSNFEINFEDLSVLMGPNGSGKSTVIHLLGVLRDFILGRAKTLDLFPTSSLTRWDQRVEQVFELDLRLGYGFYRYRVRISHARDQGLNKIIEETLTLDLKPLLTTDDDRMSLYNDSFSGGTDLMADWHVSGISRVHERKDNKKLIAFRNALEKTLVLSPNPALVSAISEKKQPITIPEPDCSDFADWLRHVAAAEAIARNETESCLANGVLPGFKLFEIKPVGDAQIVHCIFQSDKGKPIKFRLDELSSGQIALIILETAIAVVSGQNGILILDEPGNFLALSEVQPLLTQLQDGALGESYQVILTAHHPIALDTLGGAYGLWLDRDANGPTRKQRVHLEESDVKGPHELRISDLVARGWLTGLGVAPSSMEEETLAR